MTRINQAIAKLRDGPILSRETWHALLDVVEAASIVPRPDDALTYDERVDLALDDLCKSVLGDGENEK